MTLVARRAPRPRRLALARLWVLPFAPGHFGLVAISSVDLIREMSPGLDDQREHRIHRQRLRRTSKPETREGSDRDRRAVLRMDILGIVILAVVGALAGQASWNRVRSSSSAFAAGACSWLWPWALSRTAARPSTGWLDQLKAGRSDVASFLVALSCVAFAAHGDRLWRPPGRLRRWLALSGSKRTTHSGRRGSAGGRLFRERFLVTVSEPAWTFG